MEKAKASIARESGFSEEQAKWISLTQAFLVGLSRPIPEAFKTKVVYSDLINANLRVDHIERGRVTCTFSVHAAITNEYMTLHGGAVAAVAEAVALSCVRSVAGDKEFFLGEFAVTYLSAARLDEQVQVEGFLVRQGRSVIVTTVEFRTKKTKKLVYSARATYYNSPVSNL